jgi:hypothetical protein
MEFFVDQDSLQVPIDTLLMSRSRGNLTPVALVILIVFTPHAITMGTTIATRSK